MHYGKIQKFGVVTFSKGAASNKIEQQICYNIIPKAILQYVLKQCLVSTDTLGYDNEL